MTRIVALIGVAALAAMQPAAAKDARTRTSYANPTALFAAEIAFAREAQERGQWAAFRRAATKDAVMFVPQPVNAQSWLRGRAEPAVAVRWQAHKSVIACDGSMGATTGAAQWPDGSHGMFTTIWQRQKKGEYLWIVDHGAPVATPRVAPEILETQIASCSRGAPGAMAGLDRKTARRLKPQTFEWPQIASPPPSSQTGSSADQSLVWSYVATPDGGRTVVVSLRQADESMTEVIRDVVPGTTAP